MQNIFFQTKLISYFLFSIQDINYFTEILLIELTLYANKPQRNKSNLPSESSLILPEMADDSCLSADLKQKSTDSEFQIPRVKKSVKFPDQIKRPTKIPPIDIPLKLTAEYQPKPTTNRRSLGAVLRYNVRHFNRRHRNSVNLPVELRDDIRVPSARALSLDLQHVTQARWALEHLTEGSLALSIPRGSGPFNTNLHQNATYPRLHQTSVLQSLHHNSNLSILRQDSNVDNLGQNSTLHSLRQLPVLSNPRHNLTRCGLGQPRGPQASKSDISSSEESLEEFPDLSCYAKQIERLTGRVDKAKDTTKIEEDLDKWLSGDFNYPQKPFEYKYQEELVVDMLPQSTEQRLQEKKKQRLLKAETKRREYDEAKAEFEKSRPKVKPVEDVPADTFPLIKVFTRTPLGVDFMHWVEEERDRKPFWKSADEDKKKVNRRRKGKYYAKKKRWCKKGSKRSRSSPTDIPTETDESESESPKMPAIKADDDSSSDEGLTNRSLNDKSPQEPAILKENIIPRNLHEESSPETHYEESTPENPEGGFTPGIKHVGFTHENHHGERTHGAHHGELPSEIPERSKYLERVCPKKKTSFEKDKNERPPCVHEIRLLRRRLKLKMLNGRLESDELNDADEDLTDAMFDNNRLEKSPSITCLKKGKKNKQSKENLFERHPEISKEHTTKGYRRKSSSKKRPQLPNILNEISVEEWLHRSTVPPFKSSHYDERVPDKFTEFTVPNFKATMTFQDFYVKFQKAMDEFVVRKENVTTSLDFKHICSVTFTRHAIFKKGY